MVKVEGIGLDGKNILNLGNKSQQTSKRSPQNPLIYGQTLFFRYVNIELYRLVLP